MYKKGKGRLAAKSGKKAAVDDAGAAKGSAAAMRMQSDMSGLDLPSNVELKLPNPDDLMNFSVVIKPALGFWKGGVYEFKFAIPDKYPFEGPKVTCIDKIYHPNIDLQGNVCLNLLRPWKPITTTQYIIFGLLFLLAEPNPNDPLNMSAAQVLREDKDKFERNVRQAMQGRVVEGTSFPKNRGL